MIRWYQSEYVQMTPLLVLFIIPVMSAISGIRNAKLKSPINFQQGTIGCSPWRCGLSMSLISLPPFCIWCLIIGEGSSVFYLFGSFSALLMVSLTTSNILHYIPSPSIFLYLKQRFQSGKLEKWTSFLQILISLSSMFLIFMFTCSLLNAVTKLPIYIIIPIIASFSLLGVVFTGQSIVMLPVFYLIVAALSIGSGIFIYFGLEEVTSFHDIISFEYSLSKCFSSFTVGFVVGFYLLAASPLMYQMYFSLSTRHKLRLSLTFYGVFQMFFSFFLFIVTSLFTHFLETHCKLQYSTSSLFQFIKYTVPYAPVLSYSVAMSLVVLLIFIFQWITISLCSIVWEEFLKNKFKEWTAIRQLCALQASLLKLIIFIILASLTIGFSPVSYSTYMPIVFYITVTLISILVAAFICGYYMPCTNFKGCLTALIFTSAITIGTIALSIAKHPLPKLQNQCAMLEYHLTDNVNVTMTRLERSVDIFSRFPLDFLPLLTVVIFVAIALLISSTTGWQDLFVMDWNLIVWPCCMSPSMSAKAYRKRRPFVESDSFKYAQQSALPEIQKARPPPFRP